MLTVIVFAAASAAVPQASQPDAAPACGVVIERVEWLPEEPAGVIVVPSFGWSPEARMQVLAVSRILEEKALAPDESAGKIPDAEPKSRDPAVLLPDCKEAPRPKRRKRLSDYPMS